MLDNKRYSLTTPVKKFVGIYGMSRGAGGDSARRALTRHDIRERPKDYFLESGR